MSDRVSISKLFDIKRCCPYSSCMSVERAGRLLILSNRLPVRVRLEHEHVALERTIGGLTTAVGEVHRSGLWIGWPGDVTRLDAIQRGELGDRLAEERFVPVWLTPSEIARYYEGFSNGVLWPLFHYMPDRMPLASRDWTA